MKALAKDKTLRFSDCEAFRTALAGFLAQTAPTTDTARVATFLNQLFEEEIEDDRRTRGRLVEEGAQWAAEQAKKKSAHVHEPTPTPTDSKPYTVALTPPEKKSAGDARKGNSADERGFIGTYIDGRYLIRRLIGEGGMGLVYEAEHVEIGRRVAVKVLHAMYTRQQEVVSRFRSEARAATRIGHPHIVDVFDSGTTVDGAVYFVMEFLEGRDLSQLLEEEGPVQSSRAIAIARQVCTALMAAHKAGILHRDLKPENVFLIRRDGNPDFVKVLDFGIAKTMEAASERVGRLTSPGVAMGTPEYMAPEQAAGLTIDARADVYAVGAMLYEMMSGKPPHEGQNVMEVLTKKATVAPTPLEILRSDIPRDLERLIMRTLAISPDLRPQSMEGMARELSQLGGAAPTMEQPLALTDRVPRKNTPVVAAAVATAILLAGTGLWYASRSPAELPPTVIVTSPQPPAEPQATALGGTGGTAASPSGATARVLFPDRPPAVAANTPAPTAAAPPPLAPAPNVITVDRGVVLKPPTETPRPAAPNPALAIAEARRTLVRARELVAGERFAEAEELYNRVRSMGLERGAALTGLAEVAFQQQQYPEAVRLAHRAVESNGGVSAKMVLGNSYFKLGKYDEAIGQYREVLRIDGGHAEARANLAAAERRKGG
jgi:serine/threonine protein kinase